MLQHYLEQLIADMHLAAGRVPKSPIPDGVFDPDYQDMLEESPDRLMSQWFGLEKELFPPSEMLSPEELQLMTDELVQLWLAWSFYPEFPEGLPAKRRYEILRQYLDEPCQHWPGGWRQHFTFCNYEPANCPFGIEFCMCKDFESDDEMVTEMSDENELPF